MTTQPEPFHRLMALNQWPEQPHMNEVAPFTWSLDGGGKDLIDIVISSRPSSLLLEVGSFLGGSAARWLGAFPELRMICIDPWPATITDYVASLFTKDWAVNAYTLPLLHQYHATLLDYGPLAVTRNNLRCYSDRCVLLQAEAPQVFEELCSIRLNPDIVYLDASKTRNEFLAAHQAFPDAIITGDDWSWRAASGQFDVRKHVHELAEMRSARVYAHRQTFVIAEDRHGLVLPNSFQIDLGSLSLDQ